MVQVSRATGAFRSWDHLLQRRLQPNIHTRVSGVCMFRGGLEPVDGGEAWVPEVKLVVNPHARLAMPPWIAEAMNKFPPRDPPDSEPKN